jgi:hypothetical protein
MQMPPAGLAIKIFLTIVIFIIFTELFFGGHDITTKLIPHQHTDGPEIITHPNNKCLPRIDPTLDALSLDLRSSCMTWSPFGPARGRIGVVTAQFGEPQIHYGKALQSHRLHSMIHGTELHILCEPMVDDLWNKPAFILSLMLDEMLKPESQRLDWILWVDRDTIILDQCRPISSFLPPPKPGETGEIGEDHTQTHMLISNDMNGLNNGIFLMKVNHWSIQVLMDILAFSDFKPEVPLVYTEQSAMEIVLRDSKFAPHVQYVPQQWFNAYPEGSPRTYEERTIDDLATLQEYHVRRGDFLVHFAGHGDKKGEINEWYEMLRRMGNIWEGDRVQRDYTGDIQAFWARMNREKDQDRD